MTVTTAEVIHYQLITGNLWCGMTGPVRASGNRREVTCQDCLHGDEQPDTRNWTRPHSTGIPTDGESDMTYTILTEIEDHDTIIRYPAITGVTDDEASGIQATIKAQARKNYPGSTVTVKAIEESTRNGRHQ